MFVRHVRVACSPIVLRVVSRGGLAALGGPIVYKRMTISRHNVFRYHPDVVANKRHMMAPAAAITINATMIHNPIRDFFVFGDVPVLLRERG